MRPIRPQVMVLLGALACLPTGPDAAAAEREECLAEADNPHQAELCTAYIDALETLGPKLGGLVGLKMRKVALAEAYAARGLSYMKQDRFSLALADFQMATAFDPGGGVYYIYRARAYECLGMSEAAVADHRFALTIDPDLKEPHDALRRLTREPPTPPEFIEQAPQPLGTHWLALPNGKMHRVPD